jgi:uncharacterized ferredoxin-like protein
MESPLPFRSKRKGFTDFSALLKIKASRNKFLKASKCLSPESQRSCGFDCRACGFETCADMLNQHKVEAEFKGPHCMFKYADLGIAVGAADAKAKDLCIDNRVMYMIGAAARASGLPDADVVFGMPFSVTGKNIFSYKK